MTSQRRCPRCQALYGPSSLFCVRDGTPLVDRTPFPGNLPVTSGQPPMAAPMYLTLAGQMLDQRYEVGRRLGEGGMSCVYEARDLTGGQSLAIKVLSAQLSQNPKALARLRREAALALRLDHPNVCPVLRFGETPDGLLYLVMPLLIGEPLNQTLARRSRLPWHEAALIISQCSHGLQHAHDRGLVHRDLKPENLMLIPDPAAPGGSRGVVMDFGLAREQEATGELARLTETGILIGTPEFMSPEQVLGRPADSRSDVYALGIVAFELISGELPFRAPTEQQLMITRLNHPPPPLATVVPEVPPWLAAAIAKALALQPEERWQTMSAFAEAVSAPMA